MWLPRTDNIEVTFQGPLMRLLSSAPLQGPLFRTVLRLVYWGDSENVLLGRVTYPFLAEYVRKESEAPDNRKLVPAPDCRMKFFWKFMDKFVRRYGFWHLVPFKNICRYAANVLDLDHLALWFSVSQLLGTTATFSTESITTRYVWSPICWIIRRIVSPANLAATH